MLSADIGVIVPFRLVCNKGKRGCRVKEISTARCMIAFCVLGCLIIAGARCLCADDRWKTPDTLTFSIIPTEETIQELTIYKPLIDYLSKCTGKKINFYMPASYSSVVDAQVNGWVDVAVHGPFSYVIAHKKDPRIVVFATYKKQEGYISKSGPGYQSVIITKKGSNYRTVASIKGATVVLTDPESTSGNLVPRVVFTQEIGMPLEQYFKKVVYSGGHDLSIMAVYDGRIDCAFIASHRFDNVINRSVVQKEDFNYIWWSATIPQDPFAYRMDLHPQLREKIRRAFLTVHEEPTCQAWLDNVKAEKCVSMKDTDYDVIRRFNRIYEAMKSRNEKQ